MFIENDLLSTPELSPDLEWMLLSGQVSDDGLLNELVNEYFVTLFTLGRACQLSPHRAMQVVQDTLVKAVLQRHRYRAELGVRVWLFGLGLNSIRKAAATQIGAVPSPKTDETWWDEFDQLGFNSRLILILYFTYDFSEKEIAQIMRLPDFVTQASIQAGIFILFLCWRNHMSTTCQPRTAGLENHLSQAFKSRWTGLELPLHQIQTIRAQIRVWMAGRERKRDMARKATSLLLGVAALLFFIGLLRFGGTLLDPKFFPAPVAPLPPHTEHPVEVGLSVAWGIIFKWGISFRSFLV